MIVQPYDAPLTRSTFHPSPFRHTAPAVPDAAVARQRNALQSSAAPLVVLTPPCLDEQARSSEIGCVRSMRRGGPRIEAKVQGEQVVTHAYGFGGAGWTLAPGASNAAVGCLLGALQEHPEMRGQSVAIIGGGAIGMSTALALTEVQGVGQITVYAESYAGIAACHAGGLVSPVYLGTDVQAMPWLAQLANDSYRAWRQVAQEQARRPVAERYARFMPSYQAPERREPMDVYVNAGLMAPPTPVTVQFGEHGPTHAMVRYDGIFMNVRQRLDDLRTEARMRGVHFNRERIRSFDALDEPLVINCAGMGAAELAQDGNMVPVLGHLIRLGAQRKWALTQYMCGAPAGNGQFYYIPKRDAECRGVIGGTALEGERDPTARPEAFDLIWAQARQFLYGPRFGGAQAT